MLANHCCVKLPLKCCVLQPTKSTYLRKAIAAAKVEAPAPLAAGAAPGTSFRDFGSAEDVQ